jgi:tetratricopeptide (TPR) repeat protein
MFTQGLPQALETRQRALKVAQRYRYDAMMGAAHLILSFGYAYVGDTPTARQHVQRALPLYRRARLQDPYGARWWSDAWEADVAFYQGVLLEAEGRVPEALTLFGAAVSAQERNIQANKERLRSKLPAHPQDHVEIWLAMMQTYYAEALAKDGQFAAAEQEMRKALIRALRIGNDRSPLIATLLTRFASIVHDQGRYKDALELSQAAMDRFSRGRAEKASTPYLDARRAYASALAASGSWQEAMAAFDRMEEGFASDLQLSERFWLGDIYWGLALLQTGQAGKAANMLQMHVKRSAERLGPKHYRTAEAQAVLGAAFAGAGSTQQALEHFTAAIPVLVSEASQRNLLPAEQARLRQIVEAYIDLLYDLRDSELLRRASLDAREESFQVAELARIGSLQRSVMALVARASASDGGLAELVRQEQDSAQLTQALEKALMAQLAAPASYQSGPQIDALRQQLEQARTAQARLRAELTDKHPRYAQMLKPKPPSSAAVARVMAEGEALVAVFVGTRTTYVWSVNRQGSLHFARAGLGSEAARQREDLALSLIPMSLPAVDSGVRRQCRAPPVRSAAGSRAGRLGREAQSDHRAARGLVAASFQPPLERSVPRARHSGKAPVRAVSQCGVAGSAIRRHALPVHECPRCATRSQVRDSDCPNLRRYRKPGVFRGPGRIRIGPRGRRGGRRRGRPKSWLAAELAGGTCGCDRSAVRRKISGAKLEQAGSGTSAP